MFRLQPCSTVHAGSCVFPVSGFLALLSDLRLPAREAVTAEDPAGRTDSDDVAASINGDGDAYKRLVERHQNEIASVMWRFTRDRQQLDELVQDTFVEAYLSLRSFRPGAPFSPWLRKIAVRVGYRYWKMLARARRDVPLANLREIASGAEGVEPKRAAELLHRLLGKLPPRDRLVLTLFYLEDHSIAEVAELTGWSRVMVKVQAHRARRKLRQLVERELEGER